MDINNLKSSLLEAYSEKNLNKISLTLLTLYKEKQFSSLNTIAEILSDFVSIEISVDGKGFSKLMMLYHPDRGDLHRNTIIDLAQKNDFDGLLGYSHILKLQRIEEIAATLESYDDIDYSPVYQWEFQEEGYSVVDDSKTKKSKKHTSRHPKSYSFYDAFRLRIYGNTKTEVPYYYFEDIDEIELSESSVDSLDGIEFCKHAVTVDLSGNKISDLTELWGLSLIEELDISGNQIVNIDTLSNLSNLRHVDLSNNRISDLSPLFELGKLESIVVTGNPVDKVQVEELIDLGVDVEMESKR